MRRSRRSPTRSDQATRRPMSFVATYATCRCHTRSQVCEPERCRHSPQRHVGGSRKRILLPPLDSLGVFAAQQGHHLLKERSARISQRIIERLPVVVSSPSWLGITYSK